MSFNTTARRRAVGRCGPAGVWGAALVLAARARAAWPAMRRQETECGAGPAPLISTLNQGRARTHMTHRLIVIGATLGVLALGAGRAAADETMPARQSRDDAWWTGPLLAPSASTLPQGHVLIEPYLYDAKPYGHFDGAGDRHGVARENDFGSLTYLNYGLTDTVTVGVIPHFGYRRARGGGASSRMGTGDLTVQGQVRLTQFHEGSWLPGLAVAVQESLPIGKYDRLGTRPGDGFGSGAYATTGSIYSQTFFWMPTGRILRTRLDLSYTVSGRAELQDVSVYSTPAGFRGHAEPGDAFVADLAFEYSLTRNWVLALDLGYEEDAATRVAGRVTPPGGASTDFQANSGWSRSYVLAPAVEYNWNGAVGVIFGARIVVGGRNTTATATPVVAVNYVY
jgi:hypothetical protein